MILDRALQKKLLEELATVYPQQGNIQGERVEGDPTTVNLWYLDEHGLVDALKSEVIGAPPTVVAARITARGLDFLAGDGGLSAILGTVTVRLHADTIRDLLEAKIAASDLPAEEKQTLGDAIRKLPADALTAATNKLVELAIDQVPNAISIVRTMAGL